VTIRDATEDDLPTILAIYNAAIPGRMATADTEPVTVDHRLAWFREHTSTHRPLWVALRDEAIVGWPSFQAFFGRPAYHATAEVSVYVAPVGSAPGSGAPCWPGRSSTHRSSGSARFSRVRLRAQRAEPQALP
jgi:L-amino acid N-acyltransferase YncA